MARIHAETCSSLSSASIESDSVSNNLLYGKDVISINDFSRAEIELVLATAANMKKAAPAHLLKNKIIANCFFEPSTRTRLSFEAATYRLGGNTLGFTSAESTSVKKGETLRDTMQMITGYADLIVIRHPNDGAARFAADISDKPVINAGDGANQHPTQTLTDLFTIQEAQQSLEKLSIALVGDLKYGRTIHSLAQAAAHYDMRLFLVSHPLLTLPDDICNALKIAGVRFSFHDSLEDVIPKVDILYMTRIQSERFGDASQNAHEKQIVLRPSMLKQARSNLKILHPLPRVNEIDPAIDDMQYAYYFQQATNGVYVRQALLSLLLNKEVK